jgi:hypothetical protein
LVAAGFAGGPRLTFSDVCRESFANRELLAEFDRLSGTNLSLRGTAFELKIDFASGRFEPEIEQFVEFVKECVWNRL